MAEITERPVTLPDGDLRMSLNALSEIAATINSVRDPQRLLETVLETAMQTLDAERGFIFLEDDEAEIGFAVKAQQNFTPDELDGMVNEGAEGSGSVVRSVLASGEPVLLYEASADERFGSTQSVVLQHIQSIAAVPLRLKARQIGVIYLDSVSKRGRFTRQSLPFLQAFANQAAVALENATFVQSLGTG